MLGYSTPSLSWKHHLLLAVDRKIAHCVKNLQLTFHCLACSWIQLSNPHLRKHLTVCIQIPVTQESRLVFQTNSRITDLRFQWQHCCCSEAGPSLSAARQSHSHCNLPSPAPSHWGQELQQALELPPWRRSSMPGPPLALTQYELSSWSQSAEGHSISTT